jgi:hypothetical protein
MSPARRNDVQMKAEICGQRKVCATILAAIIGWSFLARADFSAAQDGASCVRWQQLFQHVQIVREAECSVGGTQIRFTAVRFHLGHTRMRLVDTETIVNEGRTVKDGIAIRLIDGKSIAEALNYGLDGVNSKIGAKPSVLAPAGWSRSQRYVEHVGLLRIDGKELHKFSTRDSISAVLCLHDSEWYGDYDAMVPVLFYQAQRGGMNERAMKCRDAVQAGPRLLGEKTRPIFKRLEAKRRPAQRVVFAVDEPNRPSLPPKSRDAARNGYILITHNPVHHFHLQQFLRERTLYGGGEPHWAVNLAGANLTGMLASVEGSPELIENTSAILGSVIVIEPR